MSESCRIANKAEILKEKILEAQELSEEIEECFPKGATPYENTTNSVSRKLTDRLAIAHNLSIKLSTTIGQKRVEEMRSSDGDS